jgi:hypothetical protein
MLTADTITDEQIRELMLDLEPEDHDARRLATLAIAGIPVKRGRRIIRRDKHGIAYQTVRARCAEILNARGGK